MCKDILIFRNYRVTSEFNNFSIWFWFDCFSSIFDVLFVEECVKTPHAFFNLAFIFLKVHPHLPCFEALTYVCGGDWFLTNCVPIGSSALCYIHKEPCFFKLQNVKDSTLWPSCRFVLLSPVFSGVNWVIILHSKKDHTNQPQG